MPDTYTFFIIDDDEDTVFTLSADLEGHGHEVSGFTVPNDFFAAFRKKIPDVVLVDMINMQMPGWQICRKIRNTAGLKNVKIIAMSGVLDPDDMKRMDVKPDFFLQKPINADDIERALKG